MRRGNPAILFVFGLFALLLAKRSPHYSDVPVVLMFELVACGVCFGIGIALLVEMIRAKKI